MLLLLYKAGDSDVWNSNHRFMYILPYSDCQSQIKKCQKPPGLEMKPDGAPAETV
jgi:hypothetical protein